MDNSGIKHYPTTLEAIHLLVLYVFMQSLVDFPLALYDYHHDSNWLNNVWINSISTFAITSFILIFGYLKTHNSIKNAFALKVFNPLLIVGILFILPAMQYLVGLLNTEIDKILPAPPWFWELFERVINNRFGFWGSVLKVAVLAPVIEELIFRGIIMHGLMRNYKPWRAIFLSGLLFSLFHLNPWQMAYTFFLGLLLGWVMIKTRSLPFAIIIHSINNLIVLFTITYHAELSENALFMLSKKDNIFLSITALLTGVLIIIVLTLNPKKSTKIYNLSFFSKHKTEL